MTSMPASRRARAMIFAPRSCPSRPGLATTTRILRVVSAFSEAASVLACIAGPGARGGLRRPGRVILAGARRGRTRGSDRSATGERPLSQSLAQGLLVELADARLWHLVDEGELVRQ